MKLRGPAPSLPLLAKELVEQAARPRTYLVRGVYALLFCGFTLWQFYTSVYRDAQGPFDVLGHGRELFDQLLYLQLVGIYLFMPALMSGVITSEKERSTLGLLILTRLGPWSIVMEKYLSRLIAMGTYLLMAVPAMTFCYAVGGLTGSDIASGMWLLAAAAVQLGAIAIACSAWSRTTVQAFILTYLVCGVLYLLPGFLSASGLLAFWGSMATRLMNYVSWTLAYFIDLFAGLFLGATVYGDSPPTFVDIMDGPVSIQNRRVFAMQGNGLMQLGDENSIQVDGAIAARLLMPVGLMFVREDSHSLLATVAMSVPSLAFSVLMLLAARFWLVRRAFIQPKNYLMRVFRVLDDAFHRMNQNRFTRGIVLTREGHSLPAYEGITWRETQKKSLGTVRYLVRVLFVLEVPAVFASLIALTAGGYSRQRGQALAFLTLTFWVLAVLFVAARCAGLVAGERQRETLDVLLSTPLWCREIIQQKVRGVRRLILVVGAPVVTCILTRFLLLWDSPGHRGGYRHGDPALLYLAVALASVWIQLPLVSWLALNFSLRLKSQGRAIFSTMTVLAAFCTAGIYGQRLFETGAGGYTVGGLFVQVVCPPLAVINAETGQLSPTGGWAWFLILGTHYFWLTTLRYFVLHRCARWLGRAEVVE